MIIVGLSDRDRGVYFQWVVLDGCYLDAGINMLKSGNGSLQASGREENW